MNEQELIDWAKTANDCLDWLDVCEGECCRTFVIQTQLKKLNRGDTIHFKINIDEEMKWYLKVHGCKISNGIVRIKLKKFKLEEDGRLFIFNQCEHQTKDNMCGIHDNKPHICGLLDYEHMDDPRIHITPRCLYKYKRMGDD